MNLYSLCAISQIKLFSGEEIILFPLLKEYNKNTDYQAGLPFQATYLSPYSLKINSEQSEQISLKIFSHLLGIQVNLKNDDIIDLNQDSLFLYNNQEYTVNYAFVDKNIFKFITNEYSQSNSLIRQKTDNNSFIHSLIHNILNNNNIYQKNYDKLLEQSNIVDKYMKMTLNKKWEKNITTNNSDNKHLYLFNEISNQIMKEKELLLFERDISTGQEIIKPIFKAK